ncbi:nitric oxide-associated protein 1-like isoform X2 [Oppia nitens]|nr:nitric oxide-associated protein 1-like isoform X2 [Oppia nitens]
MSSNISKTTKSSYLRVCQKCINAYNCIQMRQSRQSMAKHKQIMKLKRDFIIERDDRKERPLISTVFESPISYVNPMDGKLKTSLTVDILGRETFPQLTEWRKKQLISRQRRILPLPVSLTGLGDGDRPRFWTQAIKRSALILSENKSQLTLYEAIPLSLRLYFDNFADKIPKQWSLVYENYMKSKDKYLQEKSETDINSESDKILRFPYELISYVKQQNNIEKRKKSMDENNNLLEEYPRLENSLIDKEYDNYLKHHHLMQYFATNMKDIKQDEYEAEIEGWSNQFWLRNYGTPDPKAKPSDIECSGCGAHLHCNATNIPGYMPSEKFKNLSQRQLKEDKCQRCEYLTHFNVALNVNVSSDLYPQLMAKIEMKKALIVIMVDILDFPCSIWPGIINLIGNNHKIYIVGNKVDLLPKDNDLYLENALNSLKKSLNLMAINKSVRIIDYSLISAKTGFGVEHLITRLMRDRIEGEDIYLIGCTNVGKSTLFNSLMQSDLCKLRDLDLINRATTSLWPGTTLNLLKFPIRAPTGWELQLRLNRLAVLERHDIKEKKMRWSLYKQTGDTTYATLSSRIGMTYRTQIPFTVQSGHPFARKTQTPKPFDSKSEYFKNCNFFHDTPGTIYKDQLLTLLTTEELLKTIPREIITPRTFSLRPLQSLFIGGLARIDVMHARQHIWLTVFASHYLPIHVVHTEEAKRFYDIYLGTDMLGVPKGDFERIQQWPKMLPKEFVLDGKGWQQSCADIILSTAGWVAVTFGHNNRCVLKAFTPEGRGIYMRNPPLLSQGFKLRGKRILGTPCFENKLFTIDDLPIEDNKHIKKLIKNREIRHISQHRFDNLVI